MRESFEQRNSRIADEDAAMSRSFRHAEEVKSGRVTFIVEPALGTRWSVDEQSSEGRCHYSGWFASKEDAEQFVIKRKKELGI
jgi:hypothetical protein